MRRARGAAYPFLSALPLCHGRGADPKSPRSADCGGSAVAAACSWGLCRRTSQGVTDLRILFRPAKRPARVCRQRSTGAREGARLCSSQGCNILALNARRRLQPLPQELQFPSAAISGNGWRASEWTGHVSQAKKRVPPLFPTAIFICPSRPFSACVCGRRPSCAHAANDIAGRKPGKDDGRRISEPFSPSARTSAIKT